MNSKTTPSLLVATTLSVVFTGCSITSAYVSAHSDKGMLR